MNYLKLLILLPFFTGCGAIKIRDKNEAQVKQVRKVAIAAFTVQQPAAKEVGITFGDGGGFGASAGGDKMSRTSPHVTQMYNDLRDTLAKNMKWRVVALNEMTTNSGYQQAYKDTMEGWQNKMPIPDGYYQYLVEKVMDADGTRILRPAARDKLMESLGVDGILEVRINVHINANTVMGVGSRHPQTILSFRLFKKGEENPIWFDGQIKGEESKESIGKTGFFDEKLLSKLATESARTAFNKIGTTVQ